MCALVFFGTWFGGMFVTEVFMKAGLRKYVDSIADDISVPMVIFWPLAVAFYSIYKVVSVINYFTVVLAKLIRQYILRNY